MMGAPHVVEYAPLETHLKAVAFRSRLELLRILREPHTLSEITLEATRHRDGEQPLRTLARQSVQEHIDRLMEVGLVVCPERRGARGAKQYVVNAPKLYQVLEELREIGTLHGDAPAGRDETIDLGRDPPGGDLDEPHLVLIRGLTEGKVFPLRRAEMDAERGWVLGRKEGVDVSLGYDPYVSLENSEIVPGDDSYALLDLRGSKNGTFRNWRRLEKGGSVPLASGDVIGVGRSLLVFRDP